MSIRRGIAVFIFVAFCAIALSSAAINTGPGSANGNGPGPGSGYNLPVPVNYNLSDTEVADLCYIRAEEQMAHDLYAKWADMYPTPIFGNIAQAEENHINEVNFLLTRYDVEIPDVGNLSTGYTNPDIETFAKSLVTKGDASLTEAYLAGITIEEQDIQDLNAALSNTSREDFQQVYMNLLQGSENHLKAFRQALG